MPEAGRMLKDMRTTYTLSILSYTQHVEAAALLKRSLHDWYENRLKQGYRFSGEVESFLVFPETYAVLDPGEAIAAVGQDGRLLGVCFVHPRETHYSIGIVATDPSCAGTGVARAMVESVLTRARLEQKPVRLVSSLLNLDSYSLYTRLGFTPGRLYQDFSFSIPSGGIAKEPPENLSQVRSASHEDLARIVDLEASIEGIRRERDFAFFLEDDGGSWRTWVFEEPAGELQGVLVSSHQRHWKMVGPGCALDGAVAEALIWRALEQYRGESTVVLVPGSATKLVATLYAWGGRNIELHVGQSTGGIGHSNGLFFPSFLPESA